MFLKICEKSDLTPYPYAQADNVVMTMPANNLVLTYEGQIVVNCICAEDQTKKLEINSVDNVIFFPVDNIQSIESQFNQIFYIFSEF